MSDIILPERAEDRVRHGVIHHISVRVRSTPSVVFELTPPTISGRPGSS
ncbi:MAG: hypothetical protein R3C45_19745 [Phycisphaerales bacterium]